MKITLEQNLINYDNKLKGIFCLETCMKTAPYKVFNIQRRLLHQTTRNLHRLFVVINKQQHENHSN